MLTIREYRKGTPLETNFVCNVSHAFDDWLVVLGRNRDSDNWKQAKWECSTELLEEKCGSEMQGVDAMSEENCSNWIIFRFNHWGFGWVEILVVRPDSLAELAFMDSKAEWGKLELYQEDEEND